MTTGTLTIRDGNGGTQFVAVEQSGAIYTPHSVPEIEGVPVTHAAPLPVMQSGSTGTDWSLVKYTAPPAGYVTSPVVTVPVNPTRRNITIQNQSALMAIFVHDDGADSNQTMFYLAGATVSPGEGGSWTSDTHKGRIRVYLPTGYAGTDNVSISET